MQLVLAMCYVSAHPLPVSSGDPFKSPNLRSPELFAGIHWYQVLCDTSVERRPCIVFLPGHVASYLFVPFEGRVYSMKGRESR